MKKIIFGLIVLLACEVVTAQIIQVPDQGKEVAFKGIVSDVIKTPDNSFKAHYLKLSSSKTFNDNDACGEIVQNKIALNAFDLDKFVGKKVSVTGTLFCQQQYTGDYHLQDIKVKLLTP